MIVSIQLFVQTYIALHSIMTLCGAEGQGLTPNSAKMLGGDQGEGLVDSGGWTWICRMGIRRCEISSPSDSYMVASATTLSAAELVMMAAKVQRRQAMVRVVLEVAVQAVDHAEIAKVGRWTMWLKEV